MKILLMLISYIILMTISAFKFDGAWLVLAFCIGLMIGNLFTIMEINYER